MLMQVPFIPKELWPHEKEMVKQGLLKNITHEGSRHVIYEGTPAVTQDWEAVVYRHMGDSELRFLLDENQLPDTQPYQTIVRGSEGLNYCKKYFGGGKQVDTEVTVIIEFVSEKTLIETLFQKFSKAEDGCMSHGLGSKAGKTLNLFNESIRTGKTTFRPIFVRRLLKKKR